MGLYDTINNEIFCPFCGHKSKRNEYQTKSFNCYMNKKDIYNIKGVDYDFYNRCDNCYNWVEIKVLDRNPIHTLRVGKKMIQQHKKEVEAYLNGKRN